MPIWIHSAPIPPLSSPARRPRVTGERRTAQGPHQVAAHATSPVPRVRRSIRVEPRGDYAPADRVLRKVRDLAQISRRSRSDLAQISRRSRADLVQIHLGVHEMRVADLGDCDLRLRRWLVTPHDEMHRAGFLPMWRAYTAKEKVIIN